MASACKVPRLDDASFEDAIRSASVPVLVHFVNGYCRDCGQFNHPLADILPWAADRLQCYCIDAGDGTVTAARYAITRFPTILLFRAGKVVRRFVGCPLWGELEIGLRVELGSARS